MGVNNIVRESLEEIKAIDTIITPQILTKLVSQFHNALCHHEMTKETTLKSADFSKFEETHVHFMKYILADCELLPPDRTTRQKVQEFFLPYKLDDAKVDVFITLYQPLVDKLLHADVKVTEPVMKKLEFIRPFLIGYKAEYKTDKTKDRIIIKVDETIENVYEQIGGKFTISLLVRRVAYLISRDPSMEPIMRQTTVKFLEHMFTTFLSQALSKGEMEKSTIEKMQAGHKKVNLGQHHFEIFRNYLSKSILEFDLPTQTVTKVLAVFEPLKPTVLGSLAESASQASVGNSLFDQIGGASAIAVVVDHFMKHVSDDVVLAPLFKKVDVKRINQIQNRFIALVLQDRQIPEKSLEAMKKAHKKLNMDDEDFDNVKTLFKEGFQTLAVMNGQILEDIMDSLEKFRGDIIG